MSKILDITDRLTGRRRKEELEAHCRKAETLHRIVQCASCHYRCAMCGQHVTEDDAACPVDLSHRTPQLCESCFSEYEDYLELSEGRKGHGTYWHNQEWVRLWSAWMDFQRAIEAFRDSREFNRLIEELDDPSC